MRMNESDVEARVLDYFKLFYKIVKDNGLTECFDGAEGAREKSKRLVASLTPVSLTQEVKQCVRFTHKSAAANLSELFCLIAEKARKHERQFQRMKKQKEPAVRDSDKSKPSQTPNQKKRWNPNDKPPVAPTEGAGSAKLKATTEWKAKLPGQSSKQPPSPCSNCKEMHWLRDCTKATEDEKSELVKKLREARKVNKAQTKRLGEMLPSDDRKVTINGVLELPYCPGSGSDYPVISRGHWEQLKLADTSVEAEKLTTPVRTQFFGATWVTAVAKVILHVKIHTAAGPVEPMSPVKVLIVDVDADEFIVGNDWLTLLGIDVNRQLEQLAGRGEDETSGDPIELEADDMPIGSSQLPPSEEIFAAVVKLVDRAVDNGFPVNRVEQLRTIVHAYDVWHLELLADPPAKVPPLEVRLQDGAQPTKCKPRKYPPHIRDFLHDFNSRFVELGLVYENPGSRWSSPVYLVKKSSDIMDLRQTIVVAKIVCTRNSNIATFWGVALLFLHIRSCNYHQNTCKALAFQVHTATLHKLEARMVKGKKLAAGERQMIVNAYQFLKKQRDEGQGAAGRIREKVYECLGTPVSTVSNVWKEYKSRNASENEAVVEDRRGRPHSFEDEDVSPTISAYIDKRSKDRQPITAKMVADNVSRSTGTLISRRSMGRLLRRLGYWYIKGESRHSADVEDEGSDSCSGDSDQD